MAYTPRNVSIGQGALVMTSEEFVNGYQAGHLSYILESHATLGTDEELITLMLKRLVSREHSTRYSAGYIVGWIAALASKQVR